MYTLNEDSFFIKSKDPDHTLRLFQKLVKDPRAIVLVKLRSLPLDFQMSVFNTWGIPYHVDRALQHHITDLEAISLALYQEASESFSMTLLHPQAITVWVIGNNVLVERSMEPGAVYLLTKEGLGDVEVC